MLRRNSGFTLVEMLAVTVLTALLMMAALSIVSALARSKVPLPEPRGEWRSILRADLASARAATGGDRLTLITVGLIDDAGNRLQQPARVEYGIEDIAGRPWLVRWQTLLSDRGNADRTRAVLLANTRAFRAELLPSRDQEEGAPPRQVRITIDGISEVVTGW